MVIVKYSDYNTVVRLAGQHYGNVKYSDYNTVVTLGVNVMVIRERPIINTMVSQTDHKCLGDVIQMITKQHCFDRIQTDKERAGDTCSDT